MWNLQAIGMDVEEVVVTVDRKCATWKETTPCPSTGVPELAPLPSHPSCHRCREPGWWQSRMGSAAFWSGSFLLRPAQLCVEDCLQPYCSELPEAAAALLCHRHTAAQPRRAAVAGASEAGAAEQNWACLVGEEAEGRPSTSPWREVRARQGLVSSL